MKGTAGPIGSWPVGSGAGRLMNGPLSVFVRRWWAGEGGIAGYVLSVLLAPASWVYGLVVRTRNSAYDAHDSQHVLGDLKHVICCLNRVADIHIISVGNLAVGGTGKTPVAAWLTRFLSERGEQTAIVSRGYGRDERLLHQRWNPEVPVEADTDRVIAVERARDAGANVVVLDDGFQHRRLARDLDLVLLAAEDPFPGRLLPTGPYREAASSLARADVILVTRRTASSELALAVLRCARGFAPSCVGGVIRLAPDRWLDLGGEQVSAPEGDVLVVAAVARPDDFRENVAVLLGTNVELLAFRDHHDYCVGDIRRIRKAADGRAVVVTEKDAVKLTPWASDLSGAYVLTQRIFWELGRAEVEMKTTAAVGRFT